MAGRKTIMVDGGVWNKVEELKHNAYLRSSSDAIETAVDIASSDKYYAGIHTMMNALGSRFYVVESLGRTEDEAIRKLLLFEQGSVYGDLRAEDIPPADETDIEKEGLFIIECTKRLYHAGLLFNDPAHCKDYEGPEGYGNPFTCTISHTKNGVMIADSQETDHHNYYVLVEELDGSDVVRIIDYGTSPIKLHYEMLTCYEDDYDGQEEANIAGYNIKSYKIYPCTPRLFAECVGNTFQSRDNAAILATMSMNPEDDEYEEFFGHGRYEKNKDTGEQEEVIDTTPEGHYYAVVWLLGENINIVASVGETANKASLGFTGPTPIMDYFNDGKEYCESDLYWCEVERNGERVGGKNRDMILVECTAELFCKYLMKGDDDVIVCTIEGDTGKKLAKFQGSR
ncbi:MAG TPA: hypothetical protein O0X50_01675, partial [Methanocorpusculum sp.]|nr:hypothetical protein [Methanocorpusculum sp.]